MPSLLVVEQQANDSSQIMQTIMIQLRRGIQLPGLFRPSDTAQNACPLNPFHLSIKMPDASFWFALVLSPNRWASSINPK